MPKASDHLRRSVRACVVTFVLSMILVVMVIVSY
jgi:hypothetical protein